MTIRRCKLGKVRNLAVFRSSPRGNRVPTKVVPNGSQLVGSGVLLLPNDVAGFISKLHIQRPLVFSENEKSHAAARTLGRWVAAAFPTCAFGKILALVLSIVVLSFP